MKIVLIGFMCSGKSKVGRILAKKLGWSHYDTDQEVEKKTGQTIAHLINQKGEPAFRALEREAVQRLAGLDRCVISTGGGIPLNPENMEDLTKEGEVIWLRAKPETILKRAGNLRSRPLIDPEDPLGSVRRRLSDREKAYSEASHAVDTDPLDPEEIATKILSLLPSLT